MYELEDYMHETFLQRLERIFGLFWNPIRIGVSNFFFPHNIIKLDLPRSWCDKDYRLEKAAEALLIEFVDKEYDGVHNFVESAKIQSDDAYKAMMDLVDAYDFFKHELPTMEAEIEELYKDETLTQDANECRAIQNEEKPFMNYITHSKRFKIYKQLSDTLDAERNYYLEIVWRNRGYLWT